MRDIGKLIQEAHLINYLVGANNYTWLHFTDGKKVLVSKPLRYFEVRMGQFLRVHKTAIVNPQYVQDWQEPPRRQMAGEIRMRCGTIFPIGRRRWSEVLKFLMDFGQGELSLEEESTRTLIFISDQNERADLVKQTMEGHFKGCEVLHHTQGSSLPQIFKEVPDEELPRLLLIDLSSSITDRFATVERLKMDSRLASIPILLLVSDLTPKMINQGYAALANSVIIIPRDSGVFVQKLKEMGKFWLTQATLPKVRESVSVG